MKIVIDISEEVYKEICDKNYYSLKGKEALRIGVINSTVLPKGHGRIIDESQITGTFIWDNGYIECYAPTIIEADKSRVS